MKKYSKMKRLTILMPVKENSEKLQQKLVNNLTKSFGGATILPESDGYYKSKSGILIRDRINPIFVDVNLSMPKLDRLIREISVYQKLLDEELLYLTVDTIYKSAA